MLLTDIVIADVSEAQAIGNAQGAHRDRWPCLESKGVDNNILGALWEVMTSGSVGAEVLSDSVPIHQVTEDGPWVVLLPDEFRDLLATVSSDEVLSLAARWVEHEELQHARASLEYSEPYLRQLISFASAAIDARKSLLLWICM